MSVLTLKSIIKQALNEDIGRGDITTQILIPRNKKVKAIIFLREEAIVCGIEIAKQVFKALDRYLKLKSYYKDGDRVKAKKTIMEIQGRARAILTGERVALNFLSHLSGIATQTAKFVKKVKPYKVMILDTRKTLPGLRQLQKFAVSCGGGFNHRFGLWDMVLIKDNHKKAQEAKHKIPDLIKRVKQKARNKKIEIEVENLKEFKQALKAKPDIIMLDNMSLGQIKRAVKFLANNYKKTTIKLEVSGNVNLNNVRQIAKTGVDFISVGALTHSAGAIDISLKILK